MTRQRHVMTGSVPIRSEQGSLPLVILAAIVVAGIVVISFGQVRTAVSTSQNDEAFQQAIQYADAGAQAAFTFVSNNEVVAEQVLADVGGDVITSEDVGFDSEIGDGNYEWEAKRVGERNWQFRATGCVGDVCRVMEIESDRLPLFGAALYGEEIIGGQYVGNFSPGATTPSWATGEYATGTGAYDGVTGDVDDETEITAGTAGSCSLTGPSADEFTQTLFADEGSDEAVAGCEDRVQTRNFRDIAGRAFDPDRPGICTLDDAGANVIGNSATGSYGNYPDSLPADHVSGDTVTLQRGTIYCFDNMSWPAKHKLQISDGEGAVRVYIKGSLLIGGNGVANRREINVDDVDGPPDAAALQLMFAANPADPGIKLTDNNHTWVAAAIYAPQRACEVNTHTKLWGSMICNSFSIQGGVGGFNFWWDKNAASIQSEDDVGITASREEFPQSTSFDWVAID